MKLIKSNNLKLALLITVVSLSALSLNAVSDYHKELSEHRNKTNHAANNIIKMHRNMDQNSLLQAKTEHEEIEKNTKAKLANAKKIKNHQDRARLVNQIKEDRERQHKDVNARKRSRLEHSHKLKMSNLKATRDRYQSIENGIRIKYGRAIRPIKVVTTSANSNINTNTSANTSANPNVRSNTHSKPNRKTRVAKRYNHRISTTPATPATLAKPATPAKITRKKHSYRTTKPATPHSTKTKLASNSSSNSKPNRRKNRRARTTTSKTNPVNYGTVLN